MAQFVKTGDGAFVNLDLVAEMSYDAKADETTYRIIGESIWRSCQGCLLEAGVYGFRILRRGFVVQRKGRRGA